MSFFYSCRSRKLLTHARQTPVNPWSWFGHRANSRGEDLVSSLTFYNSWSHQYCVTVLYQASSYSPTPIQCKRSHRNRIETRFYCSFRVQLARRRSRASTSLHWTLDMWDISSAQDQILHRVVSRVGVSRLSWRGLLPRLLTESFLFVVYSTMGSMMRYFSAWKTLTKSARLKFN